MRQHLSATAEAARVRKPYTALDVRRADDPLGRRAELADGRLVGNAMLCRCR
jgi:hypothetical protein